MIYTKQRTPLAAENSEIAIIGLSLKWRQSCVCPLIGHGSRPLKARKNGVSVTRYKRSRWLTGFHDHGNFKRQSNEFRIKT